MRRSLLSGIGVALPLPQLFAFPRISDRVLVHRAQYIMGTVVTIAAYGLSAAHAHHAITKAFDELRRLDQMMSLYMNSSELSEVNRSAAKTSVRVSDDLIVLLQKARAYHTQTNGAFDVTIEPLMRLWGFRNEESRSIPSDREIHNVLCAVGFQNIEIDSEGKTIALLNQLSSVDLGGIAVGYSVDRVVSILKEEEIESAFVNHSGDAFALGVPDDSDGWPVVIPHPFYPNEPAARLILKDEAISTSGNYEKFVEFEHKRFGHILDPFSGRPSSEVMGTSVVAPTALDADALSTGLFCMKRESQKEFAAAHPYKIITISSTGEVESP